MVSKDSIVIDKTMGMRYLMLMLFVFTVQERKNGEVIKKK